MAMSRLYLLYLWQLRSRKFDDSKRKREEKSQIL